jgi:hypothetical protein
MVHFTDNQGIIKIYCHACDVGLCCAKEAKIKESGRGIAVGRGLDENSFLVGAVPGPDFFTDSR